MAELNITNIPAPRVPFIDERTGLMAREWYRFFLNLFVLTGSGNNPITLEELQLGPPNQPDLAELLIQINQNIAPQYEDQSGDFLATLDTAQLMSMMARFENAEAAIQGAYLQPVVQTGTIANYNLDSSPTAGGIVYGTGPALAVSAAGTLGQVLTSGGAGAPTWATDGGGTVTSVSVVSANGLAGTVATATTTPAITLSTTVTGLLKGNGTAISAATSGTDYAPATSGTSILYGNGSGGFNNVTIGTGVAFTAGTLSATGSGGTVTSVTGTAPVVSSGGTTPAISMAAATTSVNGYLTSTDWTTFNGKQAALVSGTNIKTVNGTTLLGSGDVGTITYAYGGTGQTTVTTGDLLYGSASNVWSKLGIGTTGQILRVVSGAPAWGTDYTGTVTSVGGTGTVNGLTLTGTVTSSGNLTLGGTLDLSSPPAIGATSPSTGKFTTLTATGLLSAATGQFYGASFPASGAGIEIFYSGGSGYIQGYNRTGSAYIGIIYDALNHQWNISGASKMTLDASGNLSPSGYVFSGTYTKASSYLWAAGAGGAGGVYLGAAGSSNGLISQASSGSGTTNTYIGNALITAVSDSRLKENVVNTTRNAIEILKQLRVVDHTWNDPSDQCENNRNSRGVWMGLIAQEAQPVIPWLVNKPTEDVDEDGNPQYWHMDYGYSVPLLIKAIQELSAKVAALEAIQIKEQL